MDGFGNIGLIPSFERKIAVMRSRGISASIICQTYAQGEALYKDDWDTIVGNCDSTLFLGSAEPSTTKYFTERLGRETIYTTDTSESRGTSGTHRGMHPGGFRVHRRLSGRGARGRCTPLCTP